jgi:asparagine synthase (glutamine-hydrolysing)
MRMLYWYFRDGIFAWSSEVKGILALDDINKTIDTTSPQCFMDLGYLMGEHTWFEHIKLINPATIIEFDTSSQKVEQYYYWRWSQIVPSDLTFEKAVDELGERFIEAVRKRFDPNEKIGISLSGGLDSRAILAAVNHLYPDYIGFAYTFGKPDCDDITIAKQVISRTNWRHQIFHFNDENWFLPRLEKIWNTDGMLDMMHMHGSEFLERISNDIDVNLNGYAGDVVIGGGFLDKIPLDTRISEESSKAFYKQYATLSMFDSDFYNINHVEPNIYMNRVRRFTNMGTVNGLIKTNQRKPFFDNDIIELIFSLPDEYRLRNKIYSAMLLKYFPLYFSNIPWQKTGRPVGSHTYIATNVFRKCNRIIKKICKIESNQGYTNYPKWIRNPNVSSHLKNILGVTNSHTSKIFKTDLGKRYLQPHLLKQKNFSNQILRLTTMEVYFKKVFQNV